MSVISARRQLALQFKLDSLDAEFSAWKLRSDANGVFEKHQSQIARIVQVLEPLRTRIVALAKRQNTKAVNNYFATEQMILAVHRIWEFFRSKLVQRHEPLFVNYLKVADEFAWQCYEPALRAVFPDLLSSGRKEPPLVFFNGAWSPFATPRGWTFAAEDVPGESLSGKDIDSVLMSLPVPVIGVPWFQVRVLSDALVIAHEVGHVVEFDLGLTPDLKVIVDKALARGIDSTRHDAWRAWLSEIFADVYGCVAGGPAYVAVLIDFLSALHQRYGLTVPSAGNWGDYPPDPVRVLFNLHVLEKLGFAGRAKEFKSRWEDSCESQSPSDFDSDAKKIADALLEEKFARLGDKQLQEILCFCPASQDDVERTLLEIARDKSDPRTLDTRVLLNVARSAFEEYSDQAEYLSQVIIDHIVKSIQPGTRARGTLPEPEKMSEHDSTTGNDIFERLYATVK